MDVKIEIGKWVLAIVILIILAVFIKNKAEKSVNNTSITSLG
jgi:hypothetical protein